MINKDVIEKRISAYYKRLNSFRLIMSIVSIMLYSIVILNIQKLFIRDEKTTVILGFIFMALLTLTFLVDHKKHVNYYVMKIRK